MIFPEKTWKFENMIRSNDAFVKDVVDSILDDGSPDHNHGSSLDALDSKEPLISDMINGLAKLSSLLDVDPYSNATAFQCSIFNHTLQVSRLDSKAMKAKEANELAIKLEEKLNELIAMKEEASIMKKSKESSKEKLAEKMKFYQLKSEEYYKHIKKLEAMLNEVGYTKSIKKERIEHLQEGNNTLKSELLALNKQLDDYGFNPDDKSLSVKIQELKSENDELKNRFTRFSL